MQMSQKEKDEKDLQQTVLDLLQDLNQIFTESEEESDILVVTFFFKRAHPEFVMKHAAKKLYPHKTQIENKNIKFFDDNQYIFGSLPKDRVDYYRDVIVNTKRISKSNMACIWEYLEAMIALVEPHVDHYIK